MNILYVGQPLAPYQQRAMQFKEMLDRKHAYLVRFINSDGYLKLPAEERDLLDAEESHLRALIRTIGERVTLWCKAEAEEFAAHGEQRLNQELCGMLTGHAPDGPTGECAYCGKKAAAPEVKGEAAAEQEQEQASGGRIDGGMDG